MDKKELKALRRPFVRELFRNNKFNLAMTIVAALLTSAAYLVSAWLIKEIPDLISGDCKYSFGTLLIVGAASLALILVSWLLDRAFLSEFRSKAMKQYKEYAFGKLMEKGIQAFQGENTSLYISALSNDVNTIEQDFISKLQTAIQVAAGRGVALLAAQQAGLPLYEYTPMQIKMNVTGDGHADKLQVQTMVKLLLKLSKIPKPDDAADALGAAICHASAIGPSLEEYRIK